MNKNRLSQCTCRCVVLPDRIDRRNAKKMLSQCTYRCVVLPDDTRAIERVRQDVSMHLQVRGAP